MNKKKSAPVVAHRDAQRKTSNISVPAIERNVKRLLSGICGTVSAVCAMLSYGALVEHMEGWLVSLPCCVVCTLAAVALWRWAEKGGDGHDE